VFLTLGDVASQIQRRLTVATTLRCYGSV
jgi:hypothetical protein